MPFPEASILIVDDTPMSLAATTQIIEPLGHRIVRARSGEEAVERAIAEDFAVLLMDVHMPGIDGIEALGQVRAAGRQTPVILLTGVYLEPDDARRAYAWGAVDYLVKPCDPDILRAKVGTFVALFQQRAELERRAEIIRAREKEAAEARAAQQLAETTSRLKDFYLGILGHDLRSPVNVIAMSARYLAESKLDDKQLAAIGRIERGAARMERLIRDLLDFTRGHLGGGAIPINPEDADMGQLCRGMVDELAGTHPDREIMLSTGGDLRGRWDTKRVQQVLANLIGNALQHDEGGIAVTATGDGDTVRLEVRNRGRTIPPEELPTLFEPFRKGSRSAGLGLGLYIVREIARAHGGDVAVRSEHTEGTTFTVLWPRLAPAPAANLGNNN